MITNQTPINILKMTNILKYEQFCHPRISSMQILETLGLKHHTEVCKKRYQRRVAQKVFRRMRSMTTGSICINFILIFLVVVVVLKDVICVLQFICL